MPAIARLLQMWRGILLSLAHLFEALFPTGPEGEYKWFVPVPAAPRSLAISRPFSRPFLRCIAPVSADQRGRMLPLPLFLIRAFWRRRSRIDA